MGKNMLITSTHLIALAIEPIRERSSIMSARLGGLSRIADTADVGEGVGRPAKSFEPF